MDSARGDQPQLLAAVTKVWAQAELSIYQAGKLSEGQNPQIAEASQLFTLQGKPQLHCSRQHLKVAGGRVALAAVGQMAVYEWQAMKDQGPMLKRACIPISRIDQQLDTGTLPEAFQGQQVLNRY